MALIRHSSSLLSFQQLSLQQAPQFALLATRATSHYPLSQTDNTSRKMETPPPPTTTTTIPSNKEIVVVVVRHGERLDYTMRDSGQNWTATAPCPWDPPLTDHGFNQAKALGSSIADILAAHHLPPALGAVYASPLLRCRQTAATLAASHQEQQQRQDLLKVRVEQGLAESLNENWYRSWAIAGSDGTWGYLKKTTPLNALDATTLHPASKEPIQGLLQGKWKGTEVGKEEQEWLTKHTDANYGSKNTITTPYSFHPPNFESFKTQRQRMEDTLNIISKDHVNSDKNETFVLVSHGGPVTHLYESLTGNDWTVHGDSKYCCYSVYRQKIGKEEKDLVGSSETKKKLWEPIIVNATVPVDKDVNTPQQTETKATDTTTFAWS